MSVVPGTRQFQRPSVSFVFESLSMGSIELSGKTYSTSTENVKKGVQKY